MAASSDPRVQNPDDYDRIARAIAFIRQHRRHQPDLATVAQQVNLSEFHFQRLFTQWVGISPKRFLQYLTVDYAKSRIAQSPSLLELSLDAGLSGPGRLHDLFVRLEAMSPGEFKAGGAGLEIRYGIHPTPFGRSLLAITPRGICALQFVDDDSPETCAARLQQAWPRATLHLDPAATQTFQEQVFCGMQGDRSHPLVLLVKGTNFQIQVWRALLQIPWGELTTYQRLATAIGQPGAARAIGNAVGQNPIAYLIPCHRVIRESGELGGYRWGLERKALLLGWEACRTARGGTSPPEDGQDDADDNSRGNGLTLA